MYNAFFRGDKKQLKLILIKILLPYKSSSENMLFGVNAIK
jgi:hypothetical protein